MKVKIEWEDGKTTTIPDEDEWLYRVDVVEQEDGTHWLKLSHTRLKTGFVNTQMPRQFKKITIDA